MLSCMPSKIEIGQDDIWVSDIYVPFKVDSMEYATTNLICQPYGLYMDSWVDQRNLNTRHIHLDILEMDH